MRSRSAAERRRVMNKIFRQVKNSTIFPVLAVLLLLIIINAIIQPRFFGFVAFRINSATFTPMILVAMSQAIAILLGGIDLSVGSAITLINVVLASMMRDSSVSVIGALAVGLLIGIGIGLVNGFTIGVLKLPAMVATFATSSIWYGISLIIMPQPGGYVPPFFYRLYKKVFLFLPAPLILIIIALLIWYVITRRPLFRYIMAVGGNEAAADAAGINVIAVKLKAFALAGVFTALAAIAVTCQAASGDASIGAPFTLQSVAAVIVGGIAFSGGRGRMIGAVAGALVFGFLTNVVFFANIPSLYQELIRGLIIIAALGVAILPNLKPSSLKAGG